MNREELIAKLDAKLKKENIDLKVFVIDWLIPLGVNYSYFGQMRSGFATFRPDVEKVVRDFVGV